MSKFKGFDDCAICRTMKAAEERGGALSESELLEAFEKQKQSGEGVVGFEKDLE